MSLTSLRFLIFVIIAVIGYYIIPKKYQWIWLLVFSYIYYSVTGLKITLILVLSTFITYSLALLLDIIGTKELNKKQKRVLKKSVLVMGLVLNFGMLGALKYINFFAYNINNIFNLNIQLFDLLLPLGISFYTFQSMGYLIDVYWEKYKPETNLFKFALFVSFFPQILQGPIGRFNKLAQQLYEEHSFDFVRTQSAVLRILWGFFKKMVVADNAAYFVKVIFNNYEALPGLSLFGVLAYSVQLYGDFSGGMDVVIGIAELFGIKLDENFRQPYFSRSITDFWHRWHITLGTWMKDYVFYPISLSKWMNKLGKFAKKIIGKSAGRALTMCITNIIVFLVVGIWHGAAWKFIAYGLYNGVIIGFSGMMANNYKKWKKALNINDKSKGWNLFQIIRTFILVNISWYFDMAITVSQAITMFKNSLTHFTPLELINNCLFINKDGSNLMLMMKLAIIIFGVLVIFIVSVLKEKQVDVNLKIVSNSSVLYLIVCAFLLISLPVLGYPPVSSGGFIYAQF